MPRLSAATLGNAIALAALMLLALALLCWQENTWAWPDPAPGHLPLAMLATGLYLLFCAFILWRHWQKVRQEQRAAEHMQGGNSEAAWLVAHASQTGFAEHLAWQSAEALQSSGLPVRLLPLSAVTADILASTRQALFLISTTGDGDAPDSAMGFSRRLQQENPDLSGLQYGLLALGDRDYPQFCAFGHRLDHWLRHQQAHSLFDCIEVDNGDDGALRHWQQQLSALSGNTTLADWSRPDYEHWQLAERRLLNPGSAGGPAYHIALTPAGSSQLVWQAGDIAEIGPRNSAGTIDALLRTLAHDGDTIVMLNGAACSLREALTSRLLPAQPETLKGRTAQALADLEALPHREYSIASLPGDGRLELLLRQTVLPDGRLGLGSGWLTAHAAIGADIALRIRENRGFHPPADDRPLILIGNGTGLAGLRAHIKAQALAGRHRNWLLFGERQREHDFFHRAEIERWQEQGVLSRVDLAFSRDQATRVYVQDVLQQQQDVLREWVANGAAIYVCGSLRTMAPAVQQTLVGILDSDTLEAMAEDGRYRRDVY